MEELIRREHITQVVFAYSDVAHLTVMHLASRVLACGADFRLIGPEHSLLASTRPVIAVCAVRTGCGKSMAATFNRTVSITHLPQTQFLQCRVDLTQLLAALAELDVVVTPEMETLAASMPAEQPVMENGPYGPPMAEFMAAKH